MLLLLYCTFSSPASLMKNMWVWRVQCVSTKLEPISPPSFPSFKFMPCSVSPKGWNNNHYPVYSHQAMSMLDINAESCGKKVMQRVFLDSDSKPKKNQLTGTEEKKNIFHPWPSAHKWIVHLWRNICKCSGVLCYLFTYLNIGFVEC